MSLFQCEKCGCAESTAFAPRKMAAYLFDWSAAPEDEGKLLCSACAPARYSDKKKNHYGRWHDRFIRWYLPLGMFKTNRVGDLEHIETGDTDYKKYALRFEVE